jgi:hypothetical protein
MITGIDCGFIYLFTKYSPGAAESGRGNSLNTDPLIILLVALLMQESRWWPGERVCLNLASHFLVLV